MFCENCGKQIPEDAAFCTNCGAKQTAKTGTVPISQPVSQAAAPKVERPASYQQTPKVYDEVDRISMGQYLIMFLITAIPIAGIVMLFIWAFGSETGPNKKNFARAYLIMMAIGIGLCILMSIVMGAIVASMMSTLYYY